MNVGERELQARRIEIEHSARTLPDIHPHASKIY
jgi:hypothetical protein